MTCLLQHSATVNLFVDVWVCVGCFERSFYTSVVVLFVVVFCLLFVFCAILLEKVNDKCHSSGSVSVIVC